MKGTLSHRSRSFERSVQLLMVNQFTINLGFYMLMPYLAAHLSGTLGAGRLGWSDSSSAYGTSASRACSWSAARWPTGSATSR